MFPGKELIFLPSRTLGRRLQARSLVDSDKPHLNELPTLTAQPLCGAAGKKRQRYKQPIEMPNGIGIMEALISLQKITKDNKKRGSALNELSRRHLTGGVVSADAASSPRILLL